MKRAYSTFEVKAISEDGGKRTFTGIASTPSTDLMDDIVIPTGAVYTLPLCLLWQHDSSDPIGWVTAARISAKSIEVDCEVHNEAEPGPLKQALDTYWQMLKAKLVRGLSIGFNAIETARIEGTYGYKYLSWNWLELSCVTIAANQDASITSIKSIDMEQRRAASGTAGHVVRLGQAASQRSATPRPGATGNQPSKGNPVKIAEQIAAFRAKKLVAEQRMDAIMEKSGAEGSTLDPAEKTEYDELAAEVKSIDEHVTRLTDHEARMVARAVPVGEAGTGAGAGQQREVRETDGVQLRGGVISVRRNVEPGIAFARYAIALGRAKGNIMHAAEIAKQWKDSTPEVPLFIEQIVKLGSVDAVMKAAVAAGTTSDATWAGPLVYAQNMVSEFIEFLRPQTIIGRLPGLRRVPFNIRIPRQTAGTSGTFVGEGLPTPVQKASFDALTLTWAKASTIAVLTQELVMMSNPSAEALVRNDLAAGIATYLDKRFIDPSYAGVPNVSPASISNGVASRQASGATLAAIDQDVAYLLQQVAGSELSLASAIWLMSPSLAIQLGTIRTQFGDLAFPDLGVQGGMFKGLPAITSNSIVSSGSPGEQQLFLLVQNEILLADDGQMLLDMSTEASVQMNDAPSAGAQQLVSLWQNGMVGLKCDRWINWAKRRSAAVQYIEQAQRWGS
jgi:HK97 family phage major capsid protein/HK97 family phage prohead protease